MSALIWAIVGVLLIISELIATSVIAVFFGVSAILVGLATYMGILSDLDMQLLTFSIVSIASIVLIRRHLQVWFVGNTAHTDDGQASFGFDHHGQRVTVATDFKQSMGRVVLNGVQWDALSDDDLRQGDVAYVIRQEGLTLHVSRDNPIDSASRVTRI